MNEYEYEESCFLTVLDEEKLRTYGLLMNSADIAFDKEAYEMAEGLYKAAINFSVDNWGGYKWPEAKASMQLFDLYLAQGRWEEARVAWLLAGKILGYNCQQIE